MWAYARITIIEAIGVERNPVGIGNRGMIFKPKVVWWGREKKRINKRITYVNHKIKIIQ